MKSKNQLHAVIRITSAFSKNIKLLYLDNFFQRNILQMRLIQIFFSFLQECTPLLLYKHIVQVHCCTKKITFLWAKE